MLKYVVLSLVFVNAFISSPRTNNYIDSLKFALKRSSGEKETMTINSELMREYIHFNRMDDAQTTKRRIYKLLEVTKNPSVECLGLSSLLEYYMELSQSDSAEIVANRLKGVFDLRNIDHNYNSFKVLAAYYRKQNNFDLSKATLNKGINHFSITGKTKDKYKLFGELALVHDIEGNIDSCMFYYDKQEKYFKSKDDFESLAAVFQNKGVSYYYQNNLEKAVQEFILSKEFFEKINDTITVFELNSNIGAMFSELKQFDKALVYLKDAEMFVEQHGDNRQKGRVYSFLGSCYESQGNVKQALHYHFKSLDFHQIIDSKRDIAINYHNIGALYDNIDSLDKALDFYNRAIEIKQNLGFKLSLAYSQKGVGSILLKKGKLKEADYWLSRAMTVFEEQNAKSNIKEVYQAYSELYAQKGDFKRAFNFQKKYVALKDSLESVDIKERINKLEINYEVAKKDKEILKLEREQVENNLKIAEAEIEQNKKNKIILVLTFLTLLLMLTALFYFDRIKKKETAKKDLAVNQAIFESEQKERIRIARDLHDSIGQKLAVTKMLLSSLEENENISKITSYIDETSNEVRNISHNLIPEILSFGLIKALEDLTDKINSSEKITVELKSELNREHWNARKETEVSIFRIIQEILGNIIKHAKTEEVLMEIKSFEQFIQIKIVDNGVGFNVDKMDESKGIGWKNIFARIKLINGDFKVQSEKNKGSQFFINIPTL